MAKITAFISQVRTEMKKVSWPTKQELINSTIVVLVSVLLMAVFIGICDLVFSRTITFIISGVF